MSRDEQKDNGLNPDWDDLDLDWLREEISSPEWEKTDLSWLRENVKQPAAEPAVEPDTKAEPVQTAHTETPKVSWEEVEKSIRAATRAGAQKTARPASQEAPQKTAKTRPAAGTNSRPEPTAEKTVPTWSDPPRKSRAESYPEEDTARTSRHRDAYYEDDAGRGSRRRDAYYEDDTGRGSRRRDAYYEDDTGRGSRRRDAYYEDDTGRGSRRRDTYYEDDTGRTGRRSSNRDDYYYVDSYGRDDDYRGGRSRKKTSTVMILLVILLVGGLLFAVWQLGSIFLNYHRDRSAYNDLAGNAISELAEDEDTGTAQPAEEPDEPAPVSEVPISVDWKYLRTINSDIVGWLYCPNTIINYPVVQSPDHEFYLAHGFDRQPNTSGALFADRNSTIGVATNNFIIYGHNMKDNSMFGTFKNYIDRSYFDQNPIMYFLTPDQDYRVELTCAHIVEGTVDNFPVYFSDYSAYQSYLNKISTNAFWINYDAFNTNYQMLTMSTCTSAAGYADARLLVHGVLIPIE